MQRRAFLRSGAAAAVLALARRAGAVVALPEPPLVVRAGTSYGAAHVPDSVIGTRADGTHDFVKLGADLGAHGVHVFSADNQNARYHVWAMIPPAPDGQWPYLVDGGQARAASQLMRAGTIDAAVFEVDAVRAAQLGNFGRTSPIARAPLDTGLAYAWSLVPSTGDAARGKPVRVRLRVTNGGTSGLRFAAGGRAGADPGPSRFSFRARRAADGVEIATDSPDADGLFAGKELLAGQHLDVEADLRAWIGTPGTYDVDCEYAGQLFPDTNDLGRWPEHGAETWDIAPRATLRVVIP